MQTSSYLENLPDELKLQILLTLPNVATLSALRHASPRYHAASMLARGEIFTAVTLSELTQRGISFGKPCAFAEYVVRKAPCKSFLAILLSL